MYNVSQGVFVDGSIIDAKDFLNEFGAVSSEMASMDNDLKNKIAEAIIESKKHADANIATLVVNGGSF